MVTPTKNSAIMPMLLVSVAVLAWVGTVQSASLGGFNGLNKELNYNSIPGGDNEESNMVEPMPFASITDFLSSKQGLGKKTDDTTRMKNLIKALYALDALDKKMGEKETPEGLEDEIVGTEDLEGSTSTAATAKTEAASTPLTTTTAASSTTAAAAPTAAPTNAPTTAAAPTTTITAESTTETDSTEAPTLIHDSEVNEFVDQIAKHISTFFQGILHYFDGPSTLPMDATVVIELEEKSDNSSESNETSESTGDSNADNSGESKEEISTEEIPKWLVQMFESVAALPHEDVSQAKPKEFRPKEPLQSDER